MPEKMFQQLLGLGEAWQVTQMNYLEKAQQVEIRVADTPALWRQEKCPPCARANVRGYDHAPERRWRHLNVCQLQAEIVCALPRGECLDGRKIYTVRAPWAGRSRGLTQEFEAFALTLLRAMPVKKAGEILGETDQKLWRTLFAHVVAAWQDLSWENVTWVGADEMNRRKGHNYLTVFVDLPAKRVLLAVEGKDASVWERFAEELGKHNGHPRAITRVAIDMSPAYQKGVRDNFGNAQVSEATRLTGQLRREQMQAREFSLAVRFNDFSEVGTSHRFKHPQFLNSVVNSVLEAMFREIMNEPQRPVRQIRIAMFNLERLDTHPTLWGRTNEERWGALDDATHELNQLLGKTALITGAQL